MTVLSRIRGAHGSNDVAIDVTRVQLHVVFPVVRTKVWCHGLKLPRQRTSGGRADERHEALAAQRGTSRDSWTLCTLHTHCRSLQIMRRLCALLAVTACRGDDDDAAKRAANFAAACAATDFHALVELPAAKYVHVMDFSMGIVAAKRGVPCVLRRLARRPANSRCARWYVGRYDEVRRNMYTTEMFENATKAIDGYAGIRNVHIGLDIGGPAGTPVYASV